MSEFLTVNGDLMNGIEESCKWLNDMRDKYGRLSGRIDSLTSRMEDVKRTADNVNKLTPTNDVESEQLRSIKEDAKATLNNFNADLRAASAKLIVVPDFSDILETFDESAPDIEDELVLVNRSVAKFKLSHEVTMEAEQRYKSAYGERSWQEFRELTFISTPDSPLVIEIKSSTDVPSCLEDMQNKHTILKMTKGGTEVGDLPKKEKGMLSIFALKKTVELLAINGQYLKMLNGEETKLIIEKEIATGKIVLDTVQNYTEDTIPKPSENSEIKSVEDADTASAYGCVIA